MMLHSFHTLPSRHQGAVQLFVTLVLLLILMLLGITASLVSGTQFRLSGNLQFENSAFNLAEGAMATAENWLSSGDNYADAGFVTYSTSKPYEFPSKDSMSALGLDPMTMNWTDANSCALPITTDAATGAITCSSDPGGSAQQRFVMEKIAAVTGGQVGGSGRALAAPQRVDLFRVTARGQSARGTTKTMQTTIAVPHD